MNERQSPVGIFFEMQRDAIRQTGDVVGSFVELSVEVGSTAERGVEAQREIHEQTLAVARESTHRSLDTAEVVAGAAPSTKNAPAATESLGELREAVDATFDSMLEQQAQVFDAVEGQHEEVGQDVRDAFEMQVDALVEWNERVEAQVVEAAERFVEQAEEAGDLPGAFEEQLERLTKQFEEQTQRFRDLEDQFETIEVESSRE